MSDGDSRIRWRTCLVIGAGGGLGRALVCALDGSGRAGRLIAASRAPADFGPSVETARVDITDERTIEALARDLGPSCRLDLAIVASGVLHDGDRLRPEKRLAEIDAAALARAFEINSIGPALLAKHLLPLLACDRQSVFAALSARVGSIEDNRLGGWYGYRASKAALNMLLKTASIELRRSNPTAICIGLHPGTVDTRLSKPFQSNVPADQLFAPAYAAERLLDVVARARPEQSGRCLAWDGSVIPF